MAEGSEWRTLIAGLVLSDLLAYSGGLVVAAWLVAQPWLGAHVTLGYWIVILAVLPIAAIIFMSQGLYDRQNLLGGTREYAAVIRSCVYGFVAIILLSFAVHYPVARQWTVLSSVLSAIMLGIARLEIRRIALRLRRRGFFSDRILLVGADAQGAAVARQLTNPLGGIQVVGVLDDYLPIGTSVTGGLRVLGRSTQLAQTAARAGVHDVVVVPQALPWESLQTLLARATVVPAGVRIHLVGGFYDLLAAGVRLSERNYVPLLTVKSVALTPFEAAVKRTLDCMLAAALLAALAPMSLLQLLSQGARGSPVFERRAVLGRDGRPFDLFDFRGRLATRSTLARKLPSLLNVLAGQLSMVGPRPIAVDGASQAQHFNPFALRPGLTGLWRESQDPDEQRLLDLFYIRTYSVWLDLHILFDRIKSRMRRRRTPISMLDAEPLAAKGGS